MYRTLIATEGTSALKPEHFVALHEISSVSDTATELHVAKAPVNTVYGRKQSALFDHDLSVDEVLDCREGLPVNCTFKEKIQTVTVAGILGALFFLLSFLPAVF